MYSSNDAQGATGSTPTEDEIRQMAGPGAPHLAQRLAAAITFGTTDDEWESLDMVNTRELHGMARS